MANIGDIFLRMLVDASDFQRQVVAEAEKAGSRAGAAMGGSMAAGLSRNAGQIGASLSSIGKGLTATGRSLTTGVTLPILAAGAAVTHFAMDFDTTLRRVIGLTDVTAEEIDGIRASILAMSAEVGRSPQELAEAFYFVASAGFKADEAMAVLETSAKAAAAGLGETQTIAQVLGAVINAYGKENITAARAADILVEAVSQGTAEADAFAGVIGRVVPAAAAMGVTFDEVAASLAAMTLGGLSAEEAAVGLNQVRVSLLKPTAQAEQAMADLGLSAEGLRQEIKDKGFLETLRTLEERFAGNEAAAAAVFGNIRALRTVTNLLNLDSEQLNDVFGKVEDSLGRLEEGYEQTEGPQRDFDRAMARLQASAITLGEDVLPTVTESVTSLADAVEGLAHWWSELDQPTRRAVVNFLAISAVIGPVLLVVGSLTRALGSIFTAVAKLLGPQGLATLPGRIGAVTRVVGRVGPWLALATAIFRTAEFLGNLDQEIADFTSGSPRRMVTAVRRITDAIRENPWLSFLVPATDRMLDDVEAEIERHEGSIGDTFRGWGERGPIRNGVEQGTEELVDLVGEVLEDGSVSIRDSAEVMVDPIDDAMIKAREAAAQRTRELIDAVEGVLSTAPGELQDELDAFFEGLFEEGGPFTEAERLAEIAAQGARQEWIDAFTSGDPQAEAAAFNEFSTSILDQLELLLPDVFDAGSTVPPTFMSGIANAVPAAVQALIDTGALTEFEDAFDLADQLDAMGEHVLAAYVRGMETARINRLRPETDKAKRDMQTRMEFSLYSQGYNAINSFSGGIYGAAYLAEQAANWVKKKVGGVLEFAGSPPYTHSRKIGENVGLTWGEGLRSVVERLLPDLLRTFGAVGGAMSVYPAIGTPSALPPSAALGLPGPVMGAGGMGAGTTNNYNLNVSGPLPVNEAEDAVEQMRRLQSFSLRSGG